MVEVYDFEQLLVGLVSSYRYEGDDIHAKLAQTEANILHESIKEKKANHEEVIRILTTRSKTQLVATFNRYRDEHGISITKVLMNNWKKLLLLYVMIIKMIKCIIKKRYFKYGFFLCRNWWISHLMILSRYCTQ